MDAREVYFRSVIGDGRRTVEKWRTEGGGDADGLEADLDEIELGLSDLMASGAMVS